MMYKTNNNFPLLQGCDFFLEGVTEISNSSHLQAMLHATKQFCPGTVCGLSP